MIESIWLALVLTLALMVFHLLSPYIRKLPLVPEQKMTSFGGGFAVAYVFLHLLPGLAEHKETIGAVLEATYTVTPLMDLIVYVVGLLGFLLFFGLGRLAQVRTEKLGHPLASDFYLHITAFCIYNGLLTYTMPIRVTADLGFACLFTVVMALHCIIIDRNLEHHYPEQFSHSGRFVLAGFLLLGWGLAALTEPDSVFLVALLVSFIGGSALMNVFHNELPQSGQSNFKWFTIGIVFGTGLLFLMTGLESH